MACSQLRARQQAPSCTLGLIWFQAQWLPGTLQEVGHKAYATIYGLGARASADSVWRTAMILQWTRQYQQSLGPLGLAEMWDFRPRQKAMRYQRHHLWEGLSPRLCTRLACARQL